MSKSVNEAGIPNKLLFRPDEVAKLLSLHRDTIYRWIKQGKLSAIKTPGVSLRISREEIERIFK